MGSVFSIPKYGAMGGIGGGIGGGFGSGIGSYGSIGGGAGSGIGSWGGILKPTESAGSQNKQAEEGEFGGGRY
jgi:hypothetical protein